MKENRIVRIGGDLLMLKPISYRVFRRLHLAKNSRYLCYYDGAKYFKLRKENAIPAIRKQIIQYCRQELTIPQESFVRKMGFIPVYLYNNVLLLDTIPEEIKAWFLALKSRLNNKKDVELPSSLALKHILIDRMGVNKKGREVALVGKGAAMLDFWLYKVVEGEILVRICEEQSCDRIFISSRKGNGKTSQRFCSDVHRRRALERRNKAKITI